MGWYITLAILFLLAILPLGASVLYDEDGPRVRIVAGPLKIQVFPMKKKPKKDMPKKEKPKKEPKPKIVHEPGEPGTKPQPAESSICTWFWVQSFCFQPSLPDGCQCTLRGDI